VNVEINEMSMKKFKLDYPNKEVKSGFINYILDYAIKGEPSVNYIQSIYQAMKNNDIETCIKTFQSFFASIPYSIRALRQKLRRI
jgi:N-glycosylase/DNA lyase